MTARLRYVVTYDIVDDKKRNKVANILKDYGIRVQKSVFECRVRPESLKEMRAKVVDIIDKKQDSVLIYPLCAACASRKTVLGLPPLDHKDEEFRVL